MSFVRPVARASLCGQNACSCCVESTCCETGPLVGIRSGWPGGTVGRCATHDCVIKNTDDTCVNCIHVLCLSISVVSLDPLGIL